MSSEYHPPKSISHTKEMVSYGPRGSSLIYLYKDVEKRIVDWRTIVINIDGACSDNGTPDACGGIGVYFGPWSKYNFSEHMWGVQTSQRAEIWAAFRALEVVTSTVLPEYQNRSRTQNRNRAIDQVILISDSKYVTDAMTKHVYKWRQNEWKNAKGTLVQNYLYFRRLHDRIVELIEVFGVRVLFWSVKREENGDADGLAREAVGLPGVGLLGPRLRAKARAWAQLAPRAGSSGQVRMNVQARKVEVKNSCSTPSIIRYGTTNMGLGLEKGYDDKSEDVHKPGIQEDCEIVGREHKGGVGYLDDDDE